MEYIITQSQYSIIKEYIDPLYFLKKKIIKEPEHIREPKFIPYESKFQELVDYIYKLTIKTYDKLKNLKGFKVVKVTPVDNRWSILVKPVVEDWYNWRENPSYKEEIKDFFNTKFKKILIITGYQDTIIPYDEYTKNKLDITLNLQ
jgi:hypothetical protein